MFLAFFDCKGLIFSHIVPKGSTVNAIDIVKVLDIFMKHMKKKRPALVDQGWFFHWDNAPVHTAAIVQDWLTAHSFQVLRHPPYLPDLAPADFFLFRHVKNELAGVSLDHNTLKKKWEGVTRRIGADEFATAFPRCIEIGGGYVEKT
jgi:histone-lysine N-methyltransferase SETMAR